MPRNYDLSDPTDLELMKSDFDSISADEWQEFIDFTLQDGNKKMLTYKERGVLMEARKKRLYNNYPSIRQMAFALEVAEKVEEKMNPPKTSTKTNTTQEDQGEQEKEEHKE